jgi:hypothetical protein
MNKAIKIIVHSLPFALGIALSYSFWRDGLLLLLFYGAIAASVINWGKDRRIEWWIFLYGLFAGFIIEVIGTSVSGYQSFTRPEILSIPYWLIVSWGYGFVIMKRIGFIIATGSPWKPK